MTEETSFNNQDQNDAGRKGSEENEPSQAISLEELVAIIDQEMPEDIPENGDLEKNAPFSAFQEVSGKDQYIRFFMEDILFAIPLKSALEIGHRQAITPLPGLPDWVKGVSNIRGEIVSMADLGLFFGIRKKKRTHSRHYIVVHNPEIRVGILVNRVMGICYMDRDAAWIRGNPYDETRVEQKLGRFISGVILPEGDVVRKEKTKVFPENRMLNILDIEKLLSSSRMTAFRSEKQHQAEEMSMP